MWLHRWFCTFTYSQERIVIATETAARCCYVNVLVISKSYYDWLLYSITKLLLDFQVHQPHHTVSNLLFLSCHWYLRPVPSLISSYIYNRRLESTLFGVIFLIIIFTRSSLKYIFPFSFSSSYISTTTKMKNELQEHPEWH